MAYVVQMWLSCSSTSSNAIEAFSNRWTSALQSAWASINCSSSNLGDLAHELNTRIKADCFNKIVEDIGGSMSAYQAVEAFTNSAWITGSGGLHSGHHAVYAMPASGGGTPWSFMVGSTKVYVNVTAVFDTEATS